MIISLIYFLKFGAKVQFKLILKSITFIFFEKSGSIFLFYCFLFNILIVTTVSIVKNSANIKKKFGINGCIKKIEELDPVNDISQFSGDYSEKIKDVLIKNYSKNEKDIKLHGNKL